LELGAGTGYFSRLAWRRFSGQRPRRLVISDQSGRLLEIAQREFRIDGAEYLQFDLRHPYPFEDAEFDTVLASMVFNEVPTAGLARGLRECRRVLATEGELIAAALHPQFVDSLDRRGEVRRDTRGRLSMPGAGSVRLPVVRRSREEYEHLLASAGFACIMEDVYADANVVSAKPGLRHAGRIPVAMIMTTVAPETLA
jgi:SAM-dependent methyltransferase